MNTARRGLTLPEIIVVIVIIGLAALVAGTSRPRAPKASTISELDTLQHLARRARAEAVMTGRAISRHLSWNGIFREFTAFPDGRVVGAKITDTGNTGGN